MTGEMRKEDNSIVYVCVHKYYIYLRPHFSRKTHVNIMQYGARTEANGNNKYQ